MSKTHLLEDELFLKCIKNFQKAFSRGQVLLEWDLTGDGHEQTTADQK